MEAGTQKNWAIDCMTLIILVNQHLVENWVLKNSTNINMIDNNDLIITQRTQMWEVWVVWKLCKGFSECDLNIIYCIVNATNC